MNFIFLTLISLLISFNSSATELYQTGLPARCWAMGATCITQVRGAQSLFINPAFLARMEGFDFILAQAQAGISKDGQALANQLQGSSSTISLQDIASLYGKTITADVTARGGIALPYFGLGAYSNNYLSETFQNPTFPTFNANFISDYGYFIAGAIPIGENTSFGVSARHARRWGGTKDINVSSLVGASGPNMIDQNFPDHGVGNAIDLSFATSFPKAALKPTIAVVWNDVGTTQYKMTSGTQDPPAQKDNLNFGISIEHDFLAASWTHALEYKFIGTNNEDFSKKIHLGTEASYGVLDLRGGFSQGYLTYGAGLDLWILKADVAYYAVELGTYAGQTRNDRYQYSITLELDFDQSFKLDFQGKKRRLKQRR
ncbi:MAG: hypothetical protein H7061_06185 [Bdellovibrionaceae bacterium]|nr:hypothetical protein [Bdellovibrio sp.]